MAAASEVSEAFDTDWARTGDAAAAETKSTGQSQPRSRKQTWTELKADRCSMSHSHRPPDMRRASIHDVYYTPLVYGCPNVCSPRLGACDQKSSTDPLSPGRNHFPTQARRSFGSTRRRRRARRHLGQTTHDPEKRTKFRSDPPAMLTQTKGATRASYAHVNPAEREHDRVAA